MGGVRHRRLSEATPHRRGLTFLNYKVTMRPALRYTSVFARHHLLAQRSSLLGPGPSLLRRPRRRRILASGRRVNGPRSRSHATARRAVIDPVAASWTIVRRGRRLRAVTRTLADEPGWYERTCRRGRRARASGPPRLSAAREAPPRCRAAAPHLTLKYGTIRQSLQGRQSRMLIAEDALHLAELLPG